MRKIISLFLVFTILMLSMPLTAKEKKGADLIIQNKEGEKVRGELIAVKQNSLVLLERESGADVTIIIKSVGMIKIVKKSEAFVLGFTGLLLGVVIGYLIGYPMGSEDGFMFSKAETGAIGGAIGGAVGGLGGAGIGAILGTDKIFQFEGKSETEIQEILEKLRKKARVKNAR